MAAPSVLGALASAIRDRLLAGEPAVLPGVGQIGRLHVPARVQTRPDGSKMLLPPSETVGLAAEVADAAPLAAVLQRHLALTEGDPAATLRSAVDQLEALLAATGEVRLPGVGVFQRTSGGIRFGAAPDLLASVNRAYDGLAPVGAGDLAATDAPPPAPSLDAEPHPGVTPDATESPDAPPWQLLGGSAAPEAPALETDPPAIEAPLAAPMPDAPMQDDPAPPAEAPPPPDLWASLAVPDDPTTAFTAEEVTSADPLPVALHSESDDDTRTAPVDERTMKPAVGDTEDSVETPAAETPVVEAAPVASVEEPALDESAAPSDPLDEIDGWASDTWTTSGAMPPPDALGGAPSIEDADFSLVQPTPAAAGTFVPDASASWLAAALEEPDPGAAPDTVPTAAPLPRPASPPEPVRGTRGTSPLGVVVDRVPPSPTDLDAIAAGPAPSARRRWTGLLWTLAAVALLVTAVLLLLPPRPVPTDDDTEALERPMRDRTASPAGEATAPLLAPVDTLGPAPIEGDPVPTVDPDGEAVGAPETTASGGGTTASAATGRRSPGAGEAATDRRSLGRAPATGQAIFPPRLAGLPAGDATALSGRMPVTHGSGGYTWVVLSSPARAEAAALETRYRDAGYRTGLIVTTSGGRTSYRVVVGQFDDREHALRLRDRLPPQAPPDTWPLDLR